MNDDNTYQQQLSQQEQEEQQQLAELFEHICKQCAIPIGPPEPGTAAAARLCIDCWNERMKHLPVAPDPDSDSPLVSYETRQLWERDSAMVVKNND